MTFIQGRPATLAHPVVCAAFLNIVRLAGRISLSLNGSLA